MRSARFSFSTTILLLALAGIALCCTAGAVSIKEYLLPGADSCPFGITGGPDGALWFTEWNGHSIGRISIDGAIVEYPLPTSNRYPGSITVGPDGALWFTDQDYISGHMIGRITTSGGLIEYAIPTTNSQPASIAAGPDGALWFTENTSNRIGRITTGGQFIEYAIPSSNSFPYGITAGPDGALWFTESAGNKIGRISTSGNITEYPIPTSNSGAFGITTGPDGALWFTESSKIGRTTTADVISEYSVPSDSSYPRGIVAGPDGALWFVELYAGNVGQINTTGNVTEYAIPKAAGNPENITVGSDGALWFTECAGNRIGQLQVNGSGGTAPSPTINGLSPLASNADQNQPYSGTLTATGGSGGNKWTNVAGSLPIGLSLNTDTGIISGTPTIVGASNFTIQVTDSDGQTDTKAMSLTVNTPVSLRCGSLPDGSVGSHYDSGHVFAEGGLGSQSFADAFSIISGSLPPGVAINQFDATTVNFIGVPSQAGAFQFTLRATDQYGSNAAAQCSIAISGSSGSGGSTGPVLPAGAVVNAASFHLGTDAQGAVAPGAIVAIFGSNLAEGSDNAQDVPLPATLAQAQVSFNNISAPLFFASSTQINAQVPYEMQPGPTTVQVTMAGVTASQTLNVAAFSPGLFTVNQSGGGQGAVLIGTSASVAAPVGMLPGSRPAQHGEFLSLYATGLGTVSNQPATGAAASNGPSTTATTPMVSIGGISAPVSFSGLTPGLVGLYQVNVQIPDGAPAGSAVPVVLSIGGFTSNTVTVAIQ